MSNRCLQRFQIPHRSHTYAIVQAYTAFEIAMGRAPVERQTLPNVYQIEGGPDCSIGADAAQKVWDGQRK